MSADRPTTWSATPTLPPPGAPSPTGEPASPPPRRADDGVRRSPGLWLVGLVTAVVAALVATLTSVTLLVGSGALDRADDQPDPVPATSTATDEDAPPSPASGLNVEQIADLVAPSVAAVEVQLANGTGGQGSAVIIDEDGLLVTNAHVVEGAAAVAVQLPDGSRSTAELVGADPSTDLAVLRIDAQDLPAATLATRPPEIGETAVAIGSPFGLAGSVSSGIVSAVDRTLGTPDGSLLGLIQTDAAINPGNSGGALANDRGEVIGINTAILSGSGTNSGVGFAVPAATVVQVSEQLIETGQVERAVLGVNGQDIDPSVAAAYGLDTGALLVAVEPGSGADDAGLQAGDIITEVDDTRITSMADLAVAIRGYAPGDTIEVTGIRNGEPFTVEVLLGETG